MFLKKLYVVGDFVNDLTEIIFINNSDTFSLVTNVELCQECGTSDCVNTYKHEYFL